MSAHVSRRHFLGGATALGAAAAAGALAWRDDHHDPKGSTGSTSTTSDKAGRAGSLVVVTLYGGNDGLNTVAPIHDPHYASLRGSLALDPTTTHDLGEGFALHPSLSEHKALWDRGQLAVVHGVGFEALDRSHFHCMDVWQAGSQDDLSTGWIGRWLDANGTGPLDAVAVGRRLPLLARGEKRSAATVPPGPFTLPGGATLDDLLERLSRADKNRGKLGDLAAATTTDLLSVAATVGPLVDRSPAAETLQARLDTVATLIEAGLPSRIYSVALDGFDTHANQAGAQSTLLAQLDKALGAFFARITSGVTVLVHSEFGRRVAPNASAGTDHGRGGVVLLAGQVRGGHHGEPPPLDKLVDGDLATTTDFRAIYGALLEGVLDTDAGDVLDHPPKPLSLV